MIEARVPWCIISGAHNLLPEGVETMHVMFPRETQGLAVPHVQEGASQRFLHFVSAIVVPAVLLGMDQRGSEADGGHSKSTAPWCYPKESAVLEVVLLEQHTHR